MVVIVCIIIIVLLFHKALQCKRLSFFYKCFLLNEDTAMFLLCYDIMNKVYLGLLNLS